MDAFFKWLSDNPIATYTVVFAFGAMAIMYLVAFIQGREISLWPPRVGPKPTGQIPVNQTNQNPVVQPAESKIGEIYSGFQQPTLISAERNNRLKIKSSFLLGEEGTLMFWLFVPTKGEKLRDSKFNRYVFSHQTGANFVEATKQWVNLFCFRYSSGYWQVVFSDNAAVTSPNTINLEDKLSTGWHHFLITWNKSKSELLFLIDGGKSSSKIISPITNWPEKLNPEFTIGSWTMDKGWEDRYCETQIYRFKIHEQFLEANHAVVQAELTMLPKS